MLARRGCGLKTVQLAATDFAARKEKRGRVIDKPLKMNVRKFPEDCVVPLSGERGLEFTRQFVADWEFVDLELGYDETDDEADVHALGVKVW